MKVEAVWWGVWAALAGCANSTRATETDVPDVATPDVAAADMPVADARVDAGAPVDAVDVVDAGAPVDVGTGPCVWRAGALVDPLLGPLVSVQLDDAVVSGDRVTLAVHTYDGVAPVARALHRLSFDGRLDGSAVTFGDASENSRPASLALRPGGAGVAALTSGLSRASLYLFGAAGVVDRVDLTSPSPRAMGLVASATGFTFARVLDAAPRVHEVSLDAAGATRADETSAIALEPDLSLGPGPTVLLRSLQRAGAADGSVVTVAVQQLGLTSDRGASVRVHYAVTRPGGPAGGAVESFDDRDIISPVAVLPGRMLAYARTFVIDHLGLAGGAFAVRPIDAAGHPSASPVVWALPDFGDVPTAVADTAHGPLAVVPYAHSLSSMRVYVLDRFVARPVADDGRPAGAELTLPLPGGDVRYESMLLRATPGGALLLATITANDTGRQRVVSLPLRCE